MKKKRNGFFFDLGESRGVIDVKPMNNFIMDLSGQRQKQKKIATNTLFKPISIIPTDTQMVNVQPSGEAVFHLGRGKECSLEQRRYYEENWDKGHVGIPYYAEKFLKSRPKKTAAHGGRSLNSLLCDSSIREEPRDHPQYRESRDFDAFSKKAKKHSTSISKKLDSVMGCDMSHVIHVSLPPSPFSMSEEKDDTSRSKDLYRVVTPHTGRDAELDIMTYPTGLKTIRHRGISHESLDGQYEKARRGMKNPMRSEKSRIDARRIERYWAARGKRPPEDTNQSKFGLIKLWK